MLACPPWVQKKIHHMQRMRAKCDHHYFVLQNPIMTDAAYDRLKKHLHVLEMQYPSCRTEHTVGLLPEHTPFAKIKHIAPAYSLDNIFSLDDWNLFAAKIHRFLRHEGPLVWIAEPKIDGLTLILRYEGGNLIHACTRGNGVMGEEVTHAVLSISPVPFHIPHKELIEVRGEVYMEEACFTAYNQWRITEGLSAFSSARHATSGALRQLEPCHDRMLCFMPHDVVGAEGQKIGEDYQDAMHILSSWGFSQQNRAQRCTVTEHIEQYHHALQKERSHIPYAMDGVVYKINDWSIQQRLGHGSRTPRYAVAYKFDAQSAHTDILGVQVQVGRTGVLTPVALLKPVCLGGVTIKRATLHNFQEITRKDIRVGDRVVVERAGDVIPYVAYVVQEKRSAQTAAITSPQNCPSCGERTRQDPGMVAIYCGLGMDCPAQAIASLYHFVSRDGVHIVGMGRAHVELFYYKGWIKYFADFFTLKESDMATLPNWGPLSASNMYNSIQQARHTTMEKVLYGLGIPHVGRATARILGHHYKDCESFLAAMDPTDPTYESQCEKLSSMHGVGHVTWNALTCYVARYGKHIHDLLSCLHIKHKTVYETNDTLAGKTILFTGTLTSMTRQEAKAAAERHGMHVATSFSARVNYCVVGENPGKKATQAQSSDHITLLSEEQWKNLCQ